MGIFINTTWHFDAPTLPDIDIASNLSSSLVSLKELVVTAERLKDELASSVRAAITNLTSSGSSVSVPPKFKPRSKAESPSSDRRSNIILFGLPEKASLPETKSLVDEVFSFVVGREVNWRDAFRLGRRRIPDNDQLGDNSDPPPLRLLLVKLVSERDKRLLLSAKHKLKNFTAARVFLREDTSPEVRLARAKPRKEEQELLFNPSTLHPNENRSRSRQSSSVSESSSP